MASEHFLRIEFLQSVRTLHVDIRHRMEQRMHGKPDDRSFSDDDFEYSLDVVAGKPTIFLRRTGSNAVYDSLLDVSTYQ